MAAIRGWALIGAALVISGCGGRMVHERADDLATEPAGNSGARIACGVIAE